MTGKMRGTHQKGRALLAVLILVQLAVMAWYGTQKSDYHVDEYYTFGLANHHGGKTMEFQDGASYQGDQVFLDYLAASPEHRFDYGNVWDNQREDVHPPFYYVLIHTLCSFLPGVFDKWIGISVNLVCLVLADILLYLLARKVSGSWGMGILAAFAGGFSLLAVNMVLFIRMYAMLTVFFLALALLFCAYYEKERLDAKFCILLFLIVVGGSMTQYYYLMYLFFLCLYFGVHLLIKGDRRNVLCYLGTLGAAGLACIALFPDMLRQIFGGSNRGKEAFENLVSQGTYVSYLKEYGRIMDEQLFGGLMPWVLLLLALAGAAALRKKAGDWKGNTRSWLFRGRVSMIAFGCAGYFFLVVKIAPYRTLRYIMPIGGLLLFLLLYAFWRFLGHALGKGHTRGIGLSLLVLCVVLSAAGQLRTGAVYTFGDTNAYVQEANRYQGEAAVYVYNRKWKIPSSRRELLQYGEFAFVKKKEIREWVSGRRVETLVVYLMKDMDNQELIDLICQGNPGFTSYEKIYENTYANVYCFYGAPSGTED